MEDEIGSLEVGAKLIFVIQQCEKSIQPQENMSHPFTLSNPVMFDDVISLRASREKTVKCWLLTCKKVV